MTVITDLIHNSKSVVAVGVLVEEDNTVRSAGGYIIQLLPEATEEDITYIEDKIKNTPPVSQLLDEGHTPEEILKMIFEDVEILDTQDLSFECDCSKEKMGEALAILHTKDLEDMINEDHGCEITCQFCNTHYQFSEDELKEKEMIHKRKSMKVNEAINIETLIPEGTPSYKIKGSSSQGDFQYIIQYNGLNGGKHIEYISYGVDSTNTSSEKSKIKSMKCRLFFFDGVNMQQYYIDKEIAVEDRAVIKALTKELQKAEQYDNNFLALSDKVEITSAKVENGVLKVEFSSDYTLDETLGSSTEDGLLNSLINTYGYNLGVDKVAIYFGNELYTGVKGELEPGYFKVDFSSAEIYS